MLSLFNFSITGVIWHNELVELVSARQIVLAKDEDRSPNYLWARALLHIFRSVEIFVKSDEKINPDVSVSQHSFNFL